MASGVSLLKPLGYQRSTKCGYCKKSSGSCSYYMSCDNMRNDHYQELVNRGWRRSGSTYYKPDLTRSCCPHYTIRLDAHSFKATREQRKSINRWNNFVLGPEYKRKVAVLCPQSRELVVFIGPTYDTEQPFRSKRKTRDKFDVVKAVHQSEYNHTPRPVGTKTKKPSEPAHNFEVTLELDTFTQEKHTIFLKYQTQIHKDPVSRWGEEAFKRFLCSGLNQETLKVDGKVRKLGSYHHCYRLDGRLVAVGVLDLLPQAVSSVYLFYDPDFAQWDFGKISALREIALAVEKEYNWYYMGYYIHSCTKMKYKGRYQPSYILDPEVLEWNRLDDDFRRRLDQRAYVSLSREHGLDGSISVSDPTESSDVVMSHTNTKTQKQSDTDSYELDSDPSDAEDTDIPEGSLFDHNIPGVLKKEEVKELDLDHWKILVRNMLVDFEDIRGWEEQFIDDPTSIKGIVAELAAATGPALLDNSAVILF